MNLVWGVLIARFFGFSRKFDFVRNFVMKLVLLDSVSVNLL